MPGGLSDAWFLPFAPRQGMEPGVSPPLALLTRPPEPWHVAEPLYLNSISRVFIKPISSPDSTLNSPDQPTLSGLIPHNTQDRCTQHYKCPYYVVCIRAQPPPPQLGVSHDVCVCMMSTITSASPVRIPQPPLLVPSRLHLKWVPLQSTVPPVRRFSSAASAEKPPPLCTRYFARTR